MRLLLCTLNFPPARGGIEQLCLELARELVAAGVQLEVLAPAQPGDVAFDAALPYRVRRYAADRLRHARLARALRRALAAHPDSAVLFAQWTAAGAALLSARVRRAPLFALGHAKELLTPARGFRASAPFAGYRRAVLGRLDGVLAVSRYSAERARAAGARVVHVVHPGVDAARFATHAAAVPGDAGRPVRLLTVARLVERKGIDTLIAALPAIVRAHPELQYRVVGDGPDRARLLALAGRHGVARHLDFGGAAAPDALPALYADADLFVLASREDRQSGDVEGFGLVLLEAQAAGTAVIAAESGGMPDALLPGQTGLLVPPDDPDALARAVLELLADGERRAAMAQAARAYARSRTWRAMADEVIAILAATGSGFRP